MAVHSHDKCMLTLFQTLLSPLLNECAASGKSYGKCADPAQEPRYEYVR